MVTYIPQCAETKVAIKNLESKIERTERCVDLVRTQKDNLFYKLEDFDGYPLPSKMTEVRSIKAKLKELGVNQRVLETALFRLRQDLCVLNHRQWAEDPHFDDNLYDIVQLTKKYGK